MTFVHCLYHKVSPWQLVTYVQPLTPQKKLQTLLITISLQCSLFLKRTKQIAAQGNSLPHAEPPFSNIVLHVGEVEAVLKSLDPNKATGPDEILARILKETPTTIAPSLFKLFIRSLGEGYVPSEWKLANVVPVYTGSEINFFIQAPSGD